MPACRVRLADRVQHRLVLQFHVDAETQRIGRVGNVRLVHMVEESRNKQHIVVTDDVSVPRLASRKLPKFLNSIRGIVGAIDTNRRLELVPQTLIARREPWQDTFVEIGEPPSIRWLHLIRHVKHSARNTNNYGCHKHCLRPCSMKNLKCLVQVIESSVKVSV